MAHLGKGRRPMLNQIFSVIKALNSDEHPWQISLAIVFGVFVGLTPTIAFHNIFILFFVFLINVNFSVFIFSFLLFGTLSFMLDPIFHSMGLSILNTTSLEGLWTIMYNTTFWRLMYFNNSVTMGSIVFCLVISVPMFFLCQFIVKKYRDTIMEKLNNFGLVKAVKASKLYSAYVSISNIGK